eukprot:759837-Pleurochrysis_carterae.AAC.1
MSLARRLGTSAVGVLEAFTTTPSPAEILDKGLCEMFSTRLKLEILPKRLMHRAAMRPTSQNRPADVLRPVAAKASMGEGLALVTEEESLMNIPPKQAKTKNAVL